VSPTAISLISFAFVFGGALFGCLLRTVLPERYLSDDSRQVINMGIGVISTMAAITLGLLVASAKTFYDTQSQELTYVSAKVILLDRILSHYGTEANEPRELLRAVVSGTVNRLRRRDRSRNAQLEPKGATTEVLYDKIQQLSPRTDAQHSIKAQALSIAVDLGQTHWLMLEQQQISISMPLLLALVFWLTIIFTSFGLHCSANTMTILAFLVCALSVSSAILLILEMYTPYRGLIRISSAPLQNALAHLGQ